ncbi:MAG: VWA domain-containing protein, partial [Gammaproteobacteria bacterium]|nr:VWA domain-containing protein [Gammaproteobacteria bacterium]
IRIPDVFGDTDQITGINRYRAVLAHIAAHKRWTTPIIADNYAPFQRVAVDLLEDSRVEYLAMQKYPGLRKLFLALHPEPEENACDAENESCIRHRLAMLSYAILNPEHKYKNTDVIEFANRFHEEMQNDESSTKEMAKLAVTYIARTRRQSDQSPKIHFKDTEVEYRDDNRHMWQYIEESDDEEMFDQEKKTQQDDEPEYALPPRHYPEWDYNSKTYRPDWVSLYETLHPSGNASDIDKLLAKHGALAKRLKQIMEMLKPQQYVRVRYQEEGSELDLDVAIRSLIDFKGGAQPDPRINMSHKHDGRDIAVMVLLDLSASLNDIPDGCEQSILQLSQEAVSLLGITIEGLGDDFAIAGFSSNTRHEVRYQHIKGFSENWGDDVKGRLAAMEAGYSTRMGAAMRHAAHYLGARKADKKLLLVLTDGEPSDIDIDDQRLLIEDTRKAVQELDQDGMYTYCINLDPHADEYVEDIFGKQYTVIDKIERLPEKLPLLFASLTS